MQILWKHRAVRALIGGRWEYQPNRLGWYPMDRPSNERVPPTVERVEDNTDIAIAFRVGGLLSMLTVCIATIAVMQAGWPA